MGEETTLWLGDSLATGWFSVRAITAAATRLPPPLRKKRSVLCEVYGAFLSDGATLEGRYFISAAEYS